MWSSNGFKTAYAVLSALLILLGAGMIAFPEFFVYALFRVLGAVCIIYGIVRIAGYFSRDLYKIAFQFDLALGIASILIGIMLIVLTEGVASIVPVIAGVYLLIGGALKIQSSFDARRFGLKRWWLLLISSLATLCFGAALMLCPMESIFVMTAFMGAALMVDGIQNLFFMLCASKYKR